MIGLLRRLSLLLLLLPACEGDGYVIDPFPVSVKFDHGVPEVLGCTEGLEGCEALPLTVVIDTGTPITVINPRLEPGTPLTRQHTALDIRAPAPSGGSVTRARFTGFTAFAQPLGPLGLDGDFAPGVVLGGDRLQTLAMRLDPGAGQLYFFPNIAGVDDVLGRECSAVVRSSRLGGGRYLMDGAEIPYSATRLVVGSCLNVDGNPDPTLPAEMRRPTGRGADALLVVSTGLPVTVLSRSAWLRSCKFSKLAPAVCADTTPDSMLHLPGRPPGEGIPARRATLDWLGMAADEVRSQRGPCAEILTSRIMDVGGCTQAERTAGFCFCVNGTDSLNCRAGASAEVGGPIEVAIIDDKEPLLQALRDELRPGVADVDGLLGMNALLPFVTDFDYPGSRLILRCQNDDSDTCVARPRMRTFATRRTLTKCLNRQNWAPTIGGSFPID